VNDELRHFLKKQIWIDKCGFMPEKLVAATEVFREVFGDFLLEERAEVGLDSVPELAFALVQVVYC
jgi:hypothetical protein